MVDGGRRCALPGCDAPIEDVPGRPERRYCTAAHRAAARQARRLSGVSPFSAPIAQARAAADRAADGVAHARLAEALPWVESRPREMALAGARPAASPPAAAAPPPVGAPEPAVPADLGWLYEPPAGARRRLRLPSIRRPSVRRPAFRLPAFRLPAFSLPTLPTLPRPTLSRPALLSRSMPLSRPRPAVRATPPRSVRQRRALAAIGAAGVLLIGYSITASEPEAGATAAAALSVPDFSDEQQWAEHATVVLASVNAQLDLLAQSEVAWSLLPDAVKASRPDLLAKIQERKAFLEAQKALLQSQLANFEALRHSADGLRATEQNIARLDRTLELARSGGAPEQTVTDLEASRANQLAVRDAGRAEMDSRAAGVSAATRTPLPEDAAPTTAVTDEVKAVADGQPPKPDPNPALDHRPDAVQSRESAGNPAAQVDVSGPPDPRGPGEQQTRSSDDSGGGSGGGSDSDAADRSSGDDSGSDSSDPPPHKSTAADPYLPQGSQSFSDSVVQNIDKEREARGYGPLPES